ncbi:MAG: PH domain-containing protein [Thiotrichales bacterium]|nr:PH domain-containing protein [Thiotrichales bacterium]
MAEENTETLVRKPSQLTNTGSYILGSLIIALIAVAKPYLYDLLSSVVVAQTRDDIIGYYSLLYAIPALWMLYIFLETYVTSYKVTAERVEYRHGLIIAVRDEIEIYRVKDYQLIKPLHLRMLGLSNLELATSDHSHPTLMFQAIRQGESTLEEIRNRVEAMREKKGVREID